MQNEEMNGYPISFSPYQGLTRSYSKKCLYAFLQIVLYAAKHVHVTKKMLTNESVREFTCHHYTFLPRKKYGMLAVKRMIKSLILININVND